MEDKKSKISDAQKKAGRKQDQNTDHMVIRIPKGKLAEIKEYVEAKRRENPTNPKYDSITSYIVALIEADSGLKIQNVMGNIRLNDLLAMSPEERKKYCKDHNIDLI